MYLRPSDNSTVATKSPVKRTDFRRSEFFNRLPAVPLGSGAARSLSAGNRETA